MDNINNTNLGAMDTIDEEHSTGEEDYVFKVYNLHKKIRHLCKVKHKKFIKK